MANHIKLLLWTSLVVVIFLLGFVPQHQQAKALRGELQAAQEQIRFLEWKVELGEFRDLASTVYLATNQQNYGVAQQHSTQFFDRAGELARKAHDPSLRTFLQSVLQRRDEITAGLTRGDASVRDTVEKLYVQTHKHIRN